MDVLISSPCNNNCLIDYKTQLCKGCFRTIDEIVHWINYSNEQKLIVMDKVKSRKESLIDNSAS